MSDSGKQFRSQEELEQREADALRAENALLRAAACVPEQGRLILCGVCENITRTGWDGMCPTCHSAWDERSPEREVVALEGEVERLRAVLAVFADESTWATVDAGVCEWIGWNGAVAEPWTLAQAALSPPEPEP